MKYERDWYSIERPINLAIIRLTRRDDVVVRKLNDVDDQGVDLLVELKKAGHRGGFFGVRTKGLKSHAQLRENSDETVQFRREPKALQVVPDISHPLCLFVFTMDDDEGYFKWLLKPTHASDGISMLAVDETKRLRKLTNQAVGEIVADVNTWYENRLKIPA